MQSEPSSQDEPPQNVFPVSAGGKAFRDFAVQQERKMAETIINDRCRCSHDRFRHNWGSESGGACSKPDCDCKAYAPVTVETVELPEPTQPGCAVFHRDAQGNVIPCPDEAPAEPDPEACEHTCSCGHAQWDHSSSGYCKQCDCEGSDGHYPDGCPWAPDEPHECDNCEGVDPNSCLTRLPPPEGQEYTPCVCGHIEPEHSDTAFQACNKCDCLWYRPKGDSAQPQPERRPPLSVAYSVAGGHAYEVSIPGDASVTALDGALIITHPDAQVLAITRVAPIKES